MLRDGRNHVLHGNGAIDIGARNARRRNDGQREGLLVRSGIGNVLQEPDTRDVKGFHIGVAGRRRGELGCSRSTREGLVLEVLGKGAQRGIIVPRRGEVRGSAIAKHPHDQEAHRVVRRVALGHKEVLVLLVGSKHVPGIARPINDSIEVHRALDGAHERIGGINRIGNRLVIANNNVLQLGKLPAVERVIGSIRRLLVDRNAVDWRSLGRGRSTHQAGYGDRYGGGAGDQLLY